MTYKYPPDAANDKDDIFGKVSNFCYPEGLEMFDYDMVDFQA